MNRVTIRESDCKGCCVCVKQCPKNCIAMSSDLNKSGYQYARFSAGNCTACGICYYVCPELSVITVHREKGGHRDE